MIRSVIKYISAMLLLVAVVSCKEKSIPEKASKEPARSLEYYTSILSNADIESFHGYNYSDERGWWRRDINRGFKTEWSYDPNQEQVFVKEGFTEMNKDLDLPLGIDDLAQVILLYSENKDSLRVVDVESMAEIARLALADIPVDPISFLRKIDEKKREKKLFSILHNPLNNIVEVFFTSDKQFFYIPDTVITQHQPTLDNDYIDSLSAKAVQYIYEHDKMINPNWYFNDD